MKEDSSKKGLPPNKRENQIFPPKGVSSNKMDPIKVVVRYSDGRIIKGYTQNFSPNKPIFHVRPHNVDSEQTLEISIKDLKGIFFVRDFAGDPNYKEQKVFPYGLNIIGKKIEVSFKDGEVLVGSTLGYSPLRLGFFVYPSDPNWNLTRAFVVSEAIESTRYI